MWKVQKKMPIINQANQSSPRNSVLGKVVKFLIFDVTIPFFPVVVDLGICALFKLPNRNYYDYRMQLCLLDIVLPATSIKAIWENKLFKNKHNIFSGLLMGNIILIVFSLVIYGALTYAELNKLELELEVIKRQFFVFAIMYLFAFTLGLIVQIGGGIDG